MGPRGSLTTGFYGRQASISDVIKMSLTLHIKSYDLKGMLSMQPDYGSLNAWKSCQFTHMDKNDILLCPYLRFLTQLVCLQYDAIERDSYMYYF